MQRKFCIGWRTLLPPSCIGYDMAEVNRDEGRQLGKRQVVKDGTIEYKRERERESGGEVGREGSFKFCHKEGWGGERGHLLLSNSIKLYI